MSIAFQPNSDGSAEILVTGVSRLKINADGGFNNGGPCFSAVCTTGASMTSGGNTKLLFQSKEYDTNSAYDTSLSRFKPTVAGFYLITGAFQVSGVAERFVMLYKTGALYRYGQDVTNNVSVATGTWQVYLNGTTDYLELYGYNGGATANQATTALTSYFAGALLRAT